MADDQPMQLGFEGEVPWEEAKPPEKTKAQKRQEHDDLIDSIVLTHLKTWTVPVTAEEAHDRLTVLRYKLTRGEVNASFQRLRKDSIYQTDIKEGVDWRHGKYTLRRSNL